LARTGKEFIALTGAFVDAFPGCPPYGVEFEEIIPHLTVAIGLDESDGDLLQPRLESQLLVSAPVDQVTLLVEDDAGMWQVDRSWPLLPDSSPRHL
jgi:hypothetical protein